MSNLCKKKKNCRLRQQGSRRMYYDRYLKLKYLGGDGK